MLEECFGPCRAKIMKKKCIDHFQAIRIFLIDKIRAIRAYSLNKLNAERLHE